MDPQQAQLWLKEYAETGSNAAFEALVRQYVDFVYGLAFRRLNMNSALAQDVTQKVFIDLSRSSGSLQFHPCISGWLHRHALYLAAKAHREETRRKNREQLYTDMPIGNLDEPFKAEVAEALLQLREKDRSVLLLRFYEDLTISKVSVALGLTEAAAQKRIARSLEKLRDILLRKGVSVSAATLSTAISCELTAAAPPSLAAGIMAALPAASPSLLLLDFMAKLNLKTAAAAAVLITAGGSIYWQHRTIENLRQEVSRQMQAAPIVPAPAPENPPINPELLRLRAEVARLREQAGKSNAVSPQAIVPAAKPAGFSSALQWQNKGQATPESAMETLFWAAKNKEKETLRNIIRWRKDPQVPEWDGLSEMAQSFVAGTELLARKVEGFAIQSSESLDSQTQKLQVEFLMANGTQRTEELLLSEVNGQWHPVYHVWLNKAGNLQGGMNVPASITTQSF